MRRLFRFVPSTGVALVLVACGGSASSPGARGGPDGGSAGDASKPWVDGGSGGGTGRPDATVDARAEASPTDSGRDALDAPKDTSGELAPKCTTPIVEPVAGACGVERWTVKTGLDRSVTCSMSLAATPATILMLHGFPEPSTPPRDNRLVPWERTVYALKNVLLKAYKHEPDQDYHMVIEDADGNSMVVEIPDSECMPASGPWFDLVKAARAVFDAKFTATDRFKTTSTVVSVKGVGFFDKLHGQRGMAPNGLELHPVLAFCIGKDCAI